jgi:dienelactone hydrolase
LGFNVVAIKRERVRRDGAVGEFFIPKGRGVLPGLLVLGGSDGGISYARRLGRRLAKQGYGVLSLAYFGTSGLPRTLEEVPLEYFARALDWLRQHPRVDRDRIGLFGPSKGAEAALLIASFDPRVTCVVAAAPSSVVWQSLNFRTRKAPKSSWTRDGAPLSFVAYDRSKRFKSVTAMYASSLDCAENNPAVRIPVERIEGPVLLFSGDRDALWPSQRMAEEILSRLADRSRGEHVCYPGAGHLVFPIFSKRFLLVGALLGRYFGGALRTNANARRDCLQRTLTFFETHLSKG